MSDNLTNEQVEAITHAWMDCMAMAYMGEVDVDLGGLAEASLHSMEELESAFPWLSEMRV